MAPPAAGSVPPPNSSMSTRVFESATLSMAFMSVRKELYVERSFSRDWSSPMDTIMRSNTGSSDVSDVGMSIPHWNIYCRRPVVFRHTLFPPALGPEIRRMRFWGVRVTVSGTIAFFSRFRDLSRRGWRALRSLRAPSSLTTGIPAT